MEFKTFSPKQKLAMSWWSRKPYRDYDAIICDGAVRSGKTLSMSIGFISWAMTSFQGGSFALCGKTITALKRNVMTPLALMVGAFAVTGGKILDVAPECRAQVVILQFVPDSTPSGYSTV